MDNRIGFRSRLIDSTSELVAVSCSASFMILMFSLILQQVLIKFGANTIELTLRDNALLEGIEAIPATVFCSPPLRNRGRENNISDLLL